MEGHEWGQQWVKQWRQQAVVWNLPTAAHSSSPLPCTLSEVTPALNAYTPHCPDWELPVSCERCGVLRGVPRKRLGGGGTHHCVSGFITWSLTGVFLPHLGSTFWDFLSTYDNLTYSGYKGNVIQEKELWTQSQKQYTTFQPCDWGNLSDLSFLICKINIMMPPSRTCCRN